MKAARLRGYGRALQLEEVPAPEPSGHHDVIVRIGGAGVCRTDLHIIDGMLRGLIEVELPYTLGHENAGWVEAVGDAVRSVRAGDAVIVHPAMTCGVCAGCQRGEDMYCSNQLMPGFTTDGGFAGYLRTNERALVALPESLPPARVAPYADAARRLPGGEKGRPRAESGRDGRGDRRRRTRPHRRAGVARTRSGQQC